MANSTIEEIKERLNIADVVSSYIPTKKAGTNYKAACPFHKERTASLMISPSKQIWHCFGCGEGGDVIGFVMKYENLEFAEALKILADRAGIQLPKFSGTSVAEDKRKEVLYRINDWAAKFYHKILLESSVAETARNYLKQRGLSLATIKEWQLGFAPEDFHVLENFLLKKGFTTNDLVEAGVSSRGERGQIYDRFVGRVTFPIKNYSGEIVGFTARILDPLAKGAKYINSPETLIYNKSKVIFGLHNAKQQIRKDDFAVVVEGNMDVIACHQAGFKNVVASSGTAFTFDQLQTLSRLTKNLKFAFDTDQAGLTATRRALDLALQLGFSIFIVKIEGAKDPDELIQKDRQLFADALKDAPLYLDYFFEKAFENYDPGSVQNKKTIVAQLIPLLSQLSDPLEINHYARILAQRLGSTEKTIYELLAKNKPAARNAAAATKKNNPGQAPVQTLVKSRSYFLEEKLLGYALFNPKYRKDIFENIQTADVIDPKIQQVIEALKNTEGSSEPQQTEQFIAAQGDNQQLAKLALFMVESEYSVLGDEPAFDREFHKIIKEFKTNSTKLQMSQLASEIVEAEQKKDKQKLQQLNVRFSELSKILKNI